MTQGPRRNIEIPFENLIYYTTPINKTPALHRLRESGLILCRYLLFFSRKFINGICSGAYGLALVI